MFQPMGTLTDLEIQDILDLIQYKDWEFLIRSDDDRPYLQIQFKDVCELTGNTDIQRGRKWFLSRYMVKSEIVQTAFKAILTAEEHEIREKFRYRGRAIFGPHFDVDVLYHMCVPASMDKRK